MTANGCSVSFSRDKNAGKLVMVMVTQVYKCMKNHQTAHFQQMDLTVCEFCLKAIKEPSIFAPALLINTWKRHTFPLESERTVHGVFVI